jgi:hypothetical protein
VSTCTRCNQTDRPDRFRLSLVNLAREARHEGRTHVGPDYSHELRCRDREACDRRVREATA